MTMSEVVDYLADEHGWSSSVPNLSGKLKRGSLRYGEAVELADALGYDTLKETHTELAGQLATVKEELQPMKDIRYWIGKVLTPEQSEVQKKPEPKHSVTERLKFEQEQKKQQPEQKTPQHKKQNMEL